MSITLERQSTRVYLRGDTYSIRDRIREIGGHWDPAVKAWWVGRAKAAEAEALAASVAAQPAPSAATKAEGLADDDRLLGQVEYTSRDGRTSRCWWAGQTRDGARYRLASMDGSRAWWADAASCRVVKTYEPRQRWDGRRGSGTVTVYQTWGSMRRFLAERRAQTPEQREAADARRAAIREHGGVCRCSHPLDEGDGSCMSCGLALVDAS